MNNKTFMCVAKKYEDEYDDDDEYKDEDYEYKYGNCEYGNCEYGNCECDDYSYETIFSRQVEAYGKNGGIFWGISTSGNSKNIVLAAKKAKDLGLEVIALTGEGGGELAKYSDILIDVPSRSTPRIQEMHIMIYHYMCQKIEDLYIGKG